MISLTMVIGSQIGLNTIRLNITSADRVLLEKKSVCQFVRLPCANGGCMCDVTFGQESSKKRVLKLEG